jgi:phosphate transport system permease protein
VVALLLAVPLGVGAAIYVNQIATPLEQRFIKPSIEFISAIPSVVLGFFGIAVLGQTLRALSQVSWLSWVPGFPYTERLNILTAGCLLALLAVPTIFTLAEDALNNVPRAFKEASFALGATRLQTVTRIIVPASLSGIISAVLLGLGRVIGETMVVLLCAGNRIAIPDFTAGLAVVTQPVHTMTGIIAQEMGEVVRGSIHYRALFVVGMLLFFLSLAINYAAQRIVRRYRIAIG